MSFLQNNAASNSIYNNFKQNNIYPCWNCAEPEIFEFPNYYIPLYHLEDARLEGILIAQEKNSEKSFYYLSKRVVAQIVAIRTEPYSQYWNGIMNYFDLQTYPEGRDEVFASITMPCLWFGDVCGCPDITPSGELSHSHCHILDIINPNCNEGTCPNNGGGGGGGIENIDLFDISNWVSFDGDDTGGSNTSGGNNNNGGGSGGTHNPDPRPNWRDNCNSYDGSLSAGTQVGEEILLDESTGTIALAELEDLYEMQIKNFIDDYNLPYTAKELMDIIGEQCAVSNVQEVRNCLKCYFINPLNLTNNQSWELANHFDIFIKCENDPDPDCIDCKLTLNSMALPSGTSLSSEDKSLLESAIDCSSYDCLESNPNLLESIVGLLKSDVTDPCNEDKSTSDIINEALTASLSSCSIEAMEKELAKKGSIIKPDSFAIKCPCINMILDNLLNIEDENWYCDLVQSLDEDKRLTIHIVISDITGFKTSPLNINNIKIRIPMLRCGNTDENTMAEFVHEFLHVYLYQLLKELYPNGFPSDFYITSPDDPTKIVTNPKYWIEIVRAYFDIPPEGIVSHNHHAIFYQFFLDKIVKSLFIINGKVGNESDYLYYAHIILNSSDLTGSPWGEELGLITHDDDGNLIIFDINEFKPAWDNLPGGSFKFDCEE